MFLEALSLVVSIVISLTWEDSLGSRPRFKMSCGWFLCVTRYRLPLLFLGSPSLEEGEGLAWRKGRGWPGAAVVAQAQKHSLHPAYSALSHCP